VHQISDVTPTDAPTQAQDDSQPPADVADSAAPLDIGSRGRARRRARFLRKARELAYRDLGGLVFNLHRFGARNDALVLAKLATIGQIDAELRALETALAHHAPVTILREAGITACPHCAAIHSSEDHFCPNCGLSISRQVDLLTDLRLAASAAASPAATPAQAPAPEPARAPAPARAQAPAPAPTPTGAPATTQAQAPAGSSGENEPTEIMRPPSPGS
jgi:hypothetical protein